MTHEFGPQQFWYIKLIQSADRGLRKQPKEAWGGWDTDFEENDCVYTYDEIQSQDHWNYGIVGWRGQHQLVVIDADCYDIEDFDPDLFKYPDTDIPIIKTVDDDRDIPGFHFYTLLETDDDIVAGKPYIDVKGNQKGLVASPFHRDDYIHVDNDHIRLFHDATTLNEAFEYDGDPLISSRSSWSRSVEESEIDIPDEAPDEMPRCVRKGLEARRDIPRDGTYSGRTGDKNPWQLDSAVGRLLVAHGYDKETVMDLMEEYAPRDGFDARETSYQMDRLYQKQLTPESVSTLEDLGVLENSCNCRYHSSTQQNDDVLAPMRNSRKVHSLDEI